MHMQSRPAPVLNPEHQTKPAPLQHASPGTELVMEWIHAAATQQQIRGPNEENASINNATPPVKQGGGVRASQSCQQGTIPPTHTSTEKLTTVESSSEPRTNADWRTHSARPSAGVGGRLRVHKGRDVVDEAGNCFGLLRGASVGLAAERHGVCRAATVGGSLAAVCLSLL